MGRPDDLIRGIGTRKSQNTSPTDTMSQAQTQTSADIHWRAWAKRESAMANAAFSLAWETIKARPELLVWRVLGVGVGSFVSTVASALVIVGFLLPLSLAPPDTAAWLGLSASLLTNPTFILAAAGVFAIASAITWLSDAFTQGYIWSAARGQLADEPARGSWEEAAGFTPTALLWSAITKLVRWAGALLGLGVYVSILLLNVELGQSYWPALIVALAYAGGLVFAALINMALEWAPAMIVTRSVGVGEALLHGAHAALEDFLITYRLAVRCLGVLVPAMALYSVTIVFAISVAQDPGLSALGSIARLIGELGLVIGLSVAGVLWRVSTIFVGAARQELIDELDTVLTRTQNQRAQTATWITRFGTHHDDGTTTVTPRDLIPNETPNILDIDEVLPRRARLISEELPEEE